MINLDRLYEISPKIAPRKYKKPSRENLHSRNQNSSSLEFGNSFRKNLLRNLEVFRHCKSNSHDTKLYLCKAKQSFSSFRPSINSNYSPLPKPRENNFPIDPDRKKIIKLKQS
jgi:hypothetical protein